MRPRAFSPSSAVTSRPTVSRPASTASCAMPAPIVPSPTTPTFTRRSLDHGSRPSPREALRPLGLQAFETQPRAVVDQLVARVCAPRPTGSPPRRSPPLPRKLSHRALLGTPRGTLRSSRAGRASARHDSQRRRPPFPRLLLPGARRGCPSRGRRAARRASSACSAPPSRRARQSAAAGRRRACRAAAAASRRSSRAPTTRPGARAASPSAPTGIRQRRRRTECREAADQVGEKHGRPRRRRGAVVCLELARRRTLPRAPRIRRQSTGSVSGRGQGKPSLASSPCARTQARARPRSSTRRLRTTSRPSPIRTPTTSDRCERTNSASTARAPRQDRHHASTHGGSSGVTDRGA